MSNFHATDADGKNFPSKKALRDAVSNKNMVWLTDTSAFDNRGTFELWTDLEKINPSDVIIGPDPYRDRRWYANIMYAARTGKVVIR